MWSRKKTPVDLHNIDINAYTFPDILNATLTGITNYLNLPKHFELIEVGQEPILDRPSLLSDNNPMLASVNQRLFPHFKPIYEKVLRPHKGYYRAKGFLALLKAPNLTENQKLIALYALLTESNGNDLKEKINAVLKAKELLPLIPTIEQRLQDHGYDSKQLQAIKKVLVAKIHSTECNDEVNKKRALISTLKNLTLKQESQDTLRKRSGI